MIILDMIKHDYTSILKHDEYSTMSTWASNTMSTVDPVSLVFFISIISMDFLQRIYEFYQV
jgi:hypothetical protein